MLVFFEISANFQKDRSTLLNVLSIISESTQIPMHTQPRTFTIPTSPVNKNKRTLVLGQSQNFSDLSQ